MFNVKVRKKVIKIKIPDIMTSIVVLLLPLFCEMYFYGFKFNNVVPTYCYLQTIQHIFHKHCTYTVQ